MVLQFLKVDTLPFCYRTQLRRRMDVNREIDIVEEQLQSNSLEDLNSCSSSILNSPDREDMFVDDDDYDDGINVTLLSSSIVKDSAEEPLRKNTVEKKPDASATTSGSKNGISNDSGANVPSTVVVPKDMKLKRLNGAAKKRFRYLVDHGHSRDEARVLAEKPFRVPQPDPIKRRRNADLSESTSSDTNPPKRLASQIDRGHTYQVRSSVQGRLEQAKKDNLSLDPKETAVGSGPHKPLYSEVTNYIRIGILPEGFPNIELSTQQLTMTQNEILKNVAAQRKERVKPKFGNCLFRPGHMIVICKNQDTANWLKAKISLIQPWENACLIAVEEKDIPRPEVLVGFFPRSEQDTNDEILTFVESQNEGLVVDAWRVLKRYVVKQHHVELVFTVDDVSLKSLENCKFTIDYKFGVAYLRKRNSKAEGTEGEQTAAEEGPIEETIRANEVQPIHDHGKGTKEEDSEMADPNQPACRIESKEAMMATKVFCSSSKSENKSDKCPKTSIDSFQDSTKGGEDSLVYRQILPRKTQYKTKAEKLPVDH